jgi:hypothetical protein
LSLKRSGSGTRHHIIVPIDLQGCSTPLFHLATLPNSNPCVTPLGCALVKLWRGAYGFDYLEGELENMGNIHVGRSLDRDQQIYRFISFYDLIDLLTFSQISFTSSDSLQHVVSHRAGPAPLGRIAHQAWTLLNQEDVIDWYSPGMFEPRICVISSIRALSDALFTDEATNVLIERTYRAIAEHMQSTLLRTDAAPVLNDETVSVIVSSACSAIQTNGRPSRMRLLVDLKTLLIGVIVSPDASIRFLELVSKLAQQTTSAFVSRANWPTEQCIVRCRHGLSTQYCTLADGQFKETRAI